MKTKLRTLWQRDVLYNVTNVIKCIIEYIKHQVSNIEQENDKSEAFNNFDESSGF